MKNNIPKILCASLSLLLLQVTVASALVTVGATTTIDSNVLQATITTSTEASSTMSSSTDQSGTMLNAHTTASTNDGAGVASLYSVSASPINISASSDLQKYEDSMIQSEIALKEIDTESVDNEVKVKWAHEGKLFAFIPVTVESTTIVEAEKDDTVSVDVDLPWWSIFVTGVHGVATNTETKLQESDVIKGQMGVQVSAGAKARIVHAIVSTLSLETSLASKTEIK